MSNGMQCQMKWNVKWHEMSNVKCHKMSNVVKCTMSNVVKCQMSWNVKCHEVCRICQFVRIGIGRTSLRQPPDTYQTKTTANIQKQLNATKSHEGAYPCPKMPLFLLLGAKLISSCDVHQSFSANYRYLQLFVRKLLFGKIFF
mgnify:CR=1 FL=1